MKKKIIFFLIVLLFLSFSPIVSADGLPLWRISSGKNSLYLLGSIHFFQKKFYPLPTPIEDAFIKSQLLVLETDLANLGSPQAESMLVEKGMLRGEDNLKKSLKPEIYRLAEKKVRSMGLEMILFSKLKPWFFSTTLTTLKLQSLDYHSQEGVDFYFYNRAKKSGKKILGLESLETHFSLFDDFSSLDQEKLLSQYLEEFDLLDKKAKSLVDAWFTGDQKKLESLVLRSFKKYPSLQKTLLTKRNQNWLPQIEALLKKPERTMIIVGTAHLLGKNGLLQLLKKKGYSLEQK